VKEGYVENGRIPINVFAIDGRELNKGTTDLTGRIS
jgi:hypothetical protein